MDKEKVKIPEQIAILGDRYNIVWKDKILNEKKVSCLGQWNEDEMTIFLKKGLPRHIIFRVFLHEVSHAINYKLRLSNKDVELFCNVMCFVLKDLITQFLEVNKNGE